MNVIGERQHPEKFLPKVVKKILFDEEILIHSNKDKTAAGARFYIHARDVADAVLFLLTHNTTYGDKFNIRGYREVTNLELVQLVGQIMEKTPKFKMVDFHSSRPGHDLRYALDGQKLKDMGWYPKKPFEYRLERIVKWMVKRPRWLLMDSDVGLNDHDQEDIVLE